MRDSAALWGTQWGAVIIVEGTLSHGEAGIARTQGGVFPLPYTLASRANFLSLRVLIHEMEMMIPLCRVLITIRAEVGTSK